MEKSPLELIQSLNESSELYAVRATQLSEMWERFEGYFRAMPGKLPCNIAIPGLGFLGFEKYASEWRFVFTESGTTRAVLVVGASVELKTKLALHLTTLLAVMTRLQKERVETVNAALNSMHELARMLPSTPENL